MRFMFAAAFMCVCVPKGYMACECQCVHTHGCNYLRITSLMYCLTQPPALLELAGDVDCSSPTHTLTQIYTHAHTHARTHTHLLKLDPCLVMLVNLPMQHVVACNGLPKPLLSLPCGITQRRSSVDCLN